MREGTCSPTSVWGWLVQSCIGIAVLCVLSLKWRFEKPRRRLVVFAIDCAKRTCLKLSLSHLLHHTNTHTINRGRRIGCDSLHKSLLLKGFGGCFEAGWCVSWFLLPMVSHTVMSSTSIYCTRICPLSRTFKTSRKAKRWWLGKTFNSMGRVFRHTSTHEWRGGCRQRARAFGIENSRRNERESFLWYQDIVETVLDTGSCVGIHYFDCVAPSWSSHLSTTAHLFNQSCTSHDGRSSMQTESFRSCHGHACVSTVYRHNTIHCGRLHHSIQDSAIITECW